MLRFLSGYLTEIALVVAIAAVSTAGMATYSLQAARQDLQQAEQQQAVADSQIEALREPIAVLRAHRMRLESLTQDRDQILEDINQLEGGDAPSSDFLRSAAERLFGAN